MASFNDILANVQAAIPQLTNTSAGSVYQRIIKAFSDVIDTVRTEISNTVTTIQSYVRQNRYGKVKYYEDAAKAFQYGDNLEFDENYQPYYPTIDTTKQIVKQASADISTSTVEIGGEDYPVSTLSLKVAAQDENGQLIPLTDEQKQAFDTYMKNFEIPGILLNKYSLAGNVVKFATMNCVYSPQYDQATIASGVVSAMEQFRDSMSFNSAFYPNHLEQYVRSNVPGVVDFYLAGGQIQTDTGWQPFTESVIIPAGYFNYETDFEKNITYVSGN